MHNIYIFLLLLLQCSLNNSNSSNPTATLLLPIHTNTTHTLAIVHQNCKTLLVSECAMLEKYALLSLNQNFTPHLPSHNVYIDGFNNKLTFPEHYINTPEKTTNIQCGIDALISNHIQTIVTDTITIDTIQYTLSITTEESIYSKVNGFCTTNAVLDNDCNVILEYFGRTIINNLQQRLREECGLIPLNVKGPFTTTYNLGIVADPRQRELLHIFIPVPLHYSILHVTKAEEAIRIEVSLLENNSNNTIEARLLNSQINSDKNIGFDPVIVIRLRLLMHDGDTMFNDGSNRDGSYQYSTPCRLSTFRGRRMYFNYLSKTKYGTLGVVTAQASIGVWIHENNEDHEDHKDYGMYENLSRNTYTMKWSPNINSTFDVLPDSVPIPWTKSMESLNVQDDSIQMQKKNQIKRRKIRIAHITLMNSIDGQSHVLQRTATLLPKDQFEITFVSSESFSVAPNSAISNLFKHGISVIHAPVVLDKMLSKKYFTPSIPSSSSSLNPEYDQQPGMKDDSPSMKLFITDLSKSVQAALLLAKKNPTLSCFQLLNVSYQTLLGPLVKILTGIDVVTFTNVASYQRRDVIISLAAKCAGVHSVVVDPGNLYHNPPTLIGVDALLVPSNVAAAHWQNILQKIENIQQRNLPIHVVQPGAATVASFKPYSHKNENPTEDFIQSPILLPRPITIAFLGRLAQTKNPSIILHIAKQIVSARFPQTEQEHTCNGLSKGCIPRRSHTYPIHSSWGNISSIQFVIIGNGALLQILKKMSKDMNLTDIVQFKGEVSHQDVLHQLSNHSFDMVVHPTLTNETFGLSNIEAMAAGIPIITYGVGGVADYARVRDKHCIVVNETTPFAITKVILDIISSDVKHIRNIGQLGQKYVQSRGLLEQNMVDRFAKVYTLLAGKIPRHIPLNDRLQAANVMGRYGSKIGQQCVVEKNPTRAFSSTLALWDRATRLYRGIPFNEYILPEKNGHEPDGHVGNEHVDNEENNIKMHQMNEIAKKMLLDRRQNILPNIIQQGRKVWNDLQSIQSGGISQPNVVNAWPGQFDTRGNFYLTTLHKLKHDEDQFKFNVKHGYLPNIFLKVAENYTNVRTQIKMKSSNSNIDVHDIIFLDTNYLDMIGTTYNHLNYMTHVPTLLPNESALSSNTNFNQAETDYYSEGNAPGLAIVDNFLSEKALNGMLELLQSSTIWYEIKNGYLGAYFTAGMSSNLLIQIEQELRLKMPHVVGNLTLEQVWAYKCDTTSPEGLAIHADEALVNINLWLTPTDANLGVRVEETKFDIYEDDGVAKTKEDKGKVDGDGDGGGLIVWLTRDEALPTNWNFQSLNHWDETESMYDFVKSTNSRRVVVPYKQNRATIFHSRLFHESAKFRFKAGYKNARINLTFLFGKVPKERRARERL